MQRDKKKDKTKAKNYILHTKGFKRKKGKKEKNKEKERKEKENERNKKKMEKKEIYKGRNTHPPPLHSNIRTQKKDF